MPDSTYLNALQMLKEKHQIDLYIQYMQKENLNWDFNSETIITNNSFPVLGFRSVKLQKIEMESFAEFINT